MEQTELDPEIHQKIIRELSRRRSRDLIIEELCQAAGLDWGEADRIVNEIEADHSFKIYGTQRVVLFLIGSTIAFAGFTLSGWILWEARQGAVIEVFGLAVPYPSMLIYFFLGLLMAAGGISGILRLRQE
jgi:hypothetical protein